MQYSAYNIYHMGSVSNKRIFYKKLFILMLFIISFITGCISFYWHDSSVIRDHSFPTTGQITETGNIVSVIENSINPLSHFRIGCI